MFRVLAALLVIVLGSDPGNAAYQGLESIHHRGLTPYATRTGGLTPAGHARLLLISIDGLMPSAYLGADSPAPTLRKLAARGAWAAGVTGVWPTNTRPSHTTLLTGVSPGVHGVVDNYLLDPEHRLNRTFNWFAQDIKVPTLVSAAQLAGRSTAVVMWPVSVGMNAHYLIPAFNWEHPRDKNLLRVLSTPGLLDDFERNLGARFDWPPSDRQRTQLAAFIARTRRPDVLLLYFGTLDAYQHTYGPDAAMTDSQLRDLDGQLDYLLTSLESQKLLDGTYVAVVSDHGYVKVEHEVGPNAALKREGLIETDEKRRITRWQAYSHGEGGSSLVYLKDASDRNVRVRVRGVLSSLAADTRSGIARILDHADLRTAGADPEAAFGIEMKPGYSLTEDTSVLYGPPYIAAVHGYPPTLPAMNASLIMIGPGLAGTGNIGIVRMTQIAPTLARLLGVALSPKADTPIGAIVQKLTP